MAVGSRERERRAVSAKAQQCLLCLLVSLFRLHKQEQVRCSPSSLFRLRFAEKLLRSIFGWQQSGIYLPHQHHEATAPPGRPRTACRMVLE